MNQLSRSRWTTLLIVNVALWCVLGFYRDSNAFQQRQSNEPFANSVEQRMQMIAELRQLNEQMKEQNELLRSGKLQVLLAVPR